MKNDMPRGRGHDLGAGGSPDSAFGVYQYVL
jgi:hypothetical protein